MRGMRIIVGFQANRGASESNLRRGENQSVSRIRLPQNLAGPPLAPISQSSSCGASRRTCESSLLGNFVSGALALVLGIIGIYGVIAYAVSQRRREIGIRLALGAGQRELKLMFVRDGLVLSGIGALIGLGGAMGLTRLMTSLLFEVSPLDPLAYGAAPVVLVAAALLASYLPARRAADVDPVETLKGE
jgi:predicted lysophospholipase L1 biosynthesis ABC-type transport system permease subunit